MSIQASLPQDREKTITGIPQPLLVRALETWFLFMPVAIANGVIRESVYKQVVGELAAHQISTITGVTAFFLLSFFMLRNKIDGVSKGKLFFIGALWVAMTMLFEFGFGHYVDKRSWAWLLRDYNILEGRVWGLFLLAVLATPNLVKIVHERTSAVTQE